MAPVVSDRCGGNPFYITAVVQAGRQDRGKGSVSDEKTLNRMLAVDISSGFIWGELGDQVNRWIRRVNEHKITKWILYLAALEENEEKRLIPEPGESSASWRSEGTDVPLERIREVLIRLSRGDLLEYKIRGTGSGR
jgi:hypothetical protein